MCIANFPDKDEILGTIALSYYSTDWPEYREGSHEMKSSSGDFTLRFTISIASRPTPEERELKVVSTNPPNGAIGNDPGSEISATFNAPLQSLEPGSDPFGLWPCTHCVDRVDGTISLCPDGRTIKLIPLSPLEPATSYYAILRSSLFGLQQGLWTLLTQR
jgi:Bacterial Ig-like domain